MIMSASIDEDDDVGEGGNRSIEETKSSSIVKKENLESDIYILTNDPEEVEEGIIIEATDDIELMPDDGDELGHVNFADYISGGCQLRVIVAIDFTASNGMVIFLVCSHALFVTGLPNPNLNMLLIYLPRFNHSIFVAELS